MVRIAKIYVAGPSSAHEVLSEEMQKMRELGFFITHDWTVGLRRLGGDPWFEDWRKTGVEIVGSMAMRRAGEDDLRGIQTCDALVVDLSDGDSISAGSYVEIGIAIALEKSIIAVVGEHAGCRALADGVCRRSPFLMLPRVHAVRTFPDAIRTITAFNIVDACGEGRSGGE